MDPAPLAILAPLAHWLPFGGSGLSDTVMLAIIMLLSIPLVAVLGAILVAIIKVLRSGRGRADRERDEQEARMMQEIYQGLESMEKRIEALEAILLERERKDTR